MRTIFLFLVPAILVFAAIPASAQETASCHLFSCADGTTETNCEYLGQACLQHGGVIEPFADVPFGHSNEEAITYVKAQGIVEGYADGTYKPDATINRAEFVKILVQARLGHEPQDFEPQCFGLSEEENGVRPGLWALFPDVSEKDWFALHVCAAWHDNLVSGYPDGTFRPANSINFVEAAKILAHAFDIAVPGMAEDDMWYKPYVMSVELQNAIPMSVTHFNQYITRGEMAEMVYRLKTKDRTTSSKTYDELALGSLPNVLHIQTLRVGDRFGDLSIAEIDLDADFQGIITFQGPITIPVTFADHSQGPMGPGGVCFEWDPSRSNTPYAFPVLLYDGAVQNITFCVKRTSDIESKFPVGSSGNAVISMDTYYHLALTKGLHNDQKVIVHSVEIVAPR